MVCCEPKSLGFGCAVDGVGADVMPVMESSDEVEDTALEPEREMLVISSAADVMIVV